MPIKPHEAGKPLHPAKYSDAIMYWLKEIIHAYRCQDGVECPIKILDPFAGTGRIHELAFERVFETTGIEIEQPWADMHVDTTHGDSTRMDWIPNNVFDMIVTSPTYGNRYADKHTPSDREARKWIRRSYTYDIRAMTGDPEYQLHNCNTGQFKFGSPLYTELHSRVYDECLRVMERRGWFVLNVSDHIREHKVIPVAAWHRDMLIDKGMNVTREINVETPRMRMGRNEKARVAYEKIYVLERDK